MRQLLDKWKLEPTGEVLSQGWMSTVDAVRTADGQSAILKIVDASASQEMVQHEWQALELLQSPSLVRLLAYDLEQRAFLLERLTPGSSIKVLDDERATSIAGQMMLDLRAAVPEHHSFVTTGSYLYDFARVDAKALPFDARLVERAQHVMADLVQSAPDAYLLHGDLHHGNILRHGDGYRAIDPEAVVGETACNLAAFMRNPYGSFQRAGLDRMMRRRMDQLEFETGTSGERIGAWAFARVTQIVAEKWLDTGEVHEPWLMTAEALDSALGRGLSL